MEPHEGQFLGNKNFFDSFGLFFKSTKSTCGITSPALSTLTVSEMSESQKLEALRVMGLTFIRMGGPDEETAQEIAEAISPLYPASTDAMNRELVAMLVYLKADDVLAKTIPLMNQDAAGLEEIEFDDKLLARSGQYGRTFQNQKANNPQRQQLWYAYALKNVSEGWNENLRKESIKSNPKQKKTEQAQKKNKISKNSLDSLKI